MRRRGNHGQVVIIGGAEDREGEARILREFVRLAGGTRARVSIIAAASENASEIAASYAEVFRRLGAAAAHDLKIVNRKDADGAEALAAVERATGVFFTGGDQLRITRTLGGTMNYTNLPYAEECRGLALYGVSVHVLPAGYRFDLAERAPIVPDDEGAPKKNRGTNSDAAGRQAKRTRGKR